MFSYALGFYGLLLALEQFEQVRMRSIVFSVQKDTQKEVGTFRSVA